MTVAPPEFPGAINNPLKGFRDFKPDGYGLLVLHNSIDPFSWSNLTPAVERDIATARAGL